MAQITTAHREYDSIICEYARRIIIDNTLQYIATIMIQVRRETARCRNDEQSSRVNFER